MTTGSQDQLAEPPRREFSATLVHATTVSLIGMTYVFVFHLTKPSPLARAGPLEVATAAAYAALLAFALGAITTALVAAFQALLRRTGHPRLASLVAPIALTGLTAIFVLTFVENFLYSAGGLSLKTDSSIIGKVLFGVFALAVGGLAVSRLVRMGERARRGVGVAQGGLAAISLLTIAGVALTEPTAENLEAVSEVTPYNVLILSADGIEAEQMGLYGFSRDTTPYLSSVASEFRVFENAFTNNGNTTGSIAALLSGVSPFTTGVIYPPDALSAEWSRRTLPQLLSEEGWYTSNWSVPHYAEGHDQNLVDAFHVDNGHSLRLSSLDPFAAGGVARWLLDEVQRESGGVVADVLGFSELDNPYAQVATIVGNTLTDPERLAAIEDEIETSEGPFFINSHFMVTHGPAFTVSEPYFSTGQTQTEGWEPDFYHDAIREFDGYVSAAMDVLERSGKLESTMVIVTSDHGIKYDASRRIPLAIRFPGGAHAGRETANVQRIDVAPTVLQALGFEIPTWMEGDSLLGPLPATRTIYAAGTVQREFARNMGFRPSAGDVVITAVACRQFVQRFPDGEIVSGEVPGSTAACSTSPEIPAPLSERYSVKTNESP